MKIKKTETIMGALKWEPELRFTPNGQPVATFYVVINSDDTVTCEMWNEDAENLIERDLKEDRNISVSGQWREIKWKCRNGGCKNSTTCDGEYHREQIFRASRVTCL